MMTLIAAVSFARTPLHELSAKVEQIKDAPRRLGTPYSVMRGDCPSG